MLGGVSNSLKATAAAASTGQRRDYPPFVVLVDIDGTIIGDIDAQLTEYQLLIQGPSHKKTRENQETFRGRIFKDQLVAQLMNGLMRPGFSLFCAQCALLGIPVMLYTAAEHEWATFLAPRLLQAVRLEMARELESPPLHFRFARLFTRRHCSTSKDGSCRKSLDLVVRHIHASLRRDYTMSKGLPGLIDRIIMIDNTDGILEQKQNLVLVPTYDYAHLYDVTANIDHTDSRRLQRARQLLTDVEASFLGERRARELRAATAEGKKPFRTLLYSVLSKAIAESSGTSWQQQHHHHPDNTWRTLRNQLVAYMKSETSHRSAYDLARFLSSHLRTRS